MSGPIPPPNLASETTTAATEDVDMPVTGTTAAQLAGGPAAPAASVGAAARRGVAWTAASKLAIQLVQFGTTVVLARLLTPTDYGLVAIVLVFTAFASLFTDLGLGAAIVHRSDPDHETLSTAFWLNALSGLALTGLFCGLAYPLALLFGHRSLTGLIMVGSIGFTISLYVVQLALLEKSMNFRLIAKIEFSAVVIYTVATVTLALLHFGPYSLVLGNLVQVLFTTTMMSRAVSWRPTKTFSRTAVRQLWAYSGHLVGFNIINYWGRNSDNLLIGKFLGAAPLGIYARSFNLMMLPVQQVTGVLGRVLFPAFARLAEDRERLREAYARTVVVMTTVAFPVSVGLACCATPFVSVLYGPRWVSVGPVLAILALSAPPQVISGAVGPLFQALGLTAAQFRRGLVSTLVGVVAIVVGLHWGVRGVAVGLLVRSWVMLPYTSRIAWRRIGLTAAFVLRRAWPVVTSAAVMAVAMLLIRRPVEGQPDAVVLVVQVVVGNAAYLLVLMLVGRLALAEFVGSVRGQRAVPADRTRQSASSPRHVGRHALETRSPRANRAADD
ncbi:lipopolysaccharide biosynthesis protein [uncultured Jatrophihabitans sp.]|uniref:lipopolysaccharide biosynthesis protein n=1 Tax=uncultured Jatrophihabitans sp. TaxID=1610747 RepID=UPI0035CBC8C6